MSKTSMTKAILTVGALCLVCALALCTVCACAPSNESVIRSSIARELDSYKNADAQAMAKIAEALDSEGVADFGIDTGEFAASVLEGFDYSIDQITIDGAVAQANITITSKSLTDFQEKLTQAVDEFTVSPAAQAMSTDQINLSIGAIAMQAVEDTEVGEEQAVLAFELDGNVWTCANINEVLSGLDSLVFAR